MVHLKVTLYAAVYILYYDEITDLITTVINAVVLVDFSVTIKELLMKDLILVSRTLTSLLF